MTICGIVYIFCIIFYNNSFLLEQFAMATSFGCVVWFITIIFQKEIATEVRQIRKKIKSYLKK
jgi:hypothetical protein